MERNGKNIGLVYGVFTIWSKGEASFFSFKKNAQFQEFNAQDASD